jgi:hypothetical protein
VALPVDSRACPRRETTAASKLKSQIKRAGDIDHIPRFVIVKIVSRFPDYFMWGPVGMGATGMWNLTCEIWHVDAGGNQVGVLALVRTLGADQGTGLL